MNFCYDAVNEVLDQVSNVECKNAQVAKLAGTRLDILPHKPIGSLLCREKLPAKFSNAPGQIHAAGACIQDFVALRNEPGDSDLAHSGGAPAAIPDDDPVFVGWGQKLERTLCEQGYGKRSASRGVTGASWALSAKQFHRLVNRHPVPDRKSVV